MRIRRFNENDQISKERVDEIVKDLREFSDILEGKQKEIVSLIEELGRYTTEDAKKIDDVGNSITALQIVKDDLANSIDKIDNAVLDLEKYNPFLLV
jgi:hypothetical protein